MGKFHAVIHNHINLLRGLGIGLGILLGIGDVCAPSSVRAGYSSSSRGRGGAPPFCVFILRYMSVEVHEC